MSRPAASPWLLALLTIPFRASTAAAQSVELAPGIEYVPGAPACDEAAGYGAEDSERARRARLRCRMAAFERRLAARREGEQIEQQERLAQVLRSYMEKTRPARDSRPYSVVGFGGAAPGASGGGLASYGVAALWTPRTDLELGPWLGFAKGGKSAFTYRLPESGCHVGDVQDDRTVMGVLARWLVTRRDLTPFVGGGIAFVDTRVEAYSFGCVPGGRAGDPPRRDGVSTWKTGDAIAHLLTGEAGLQFVARNGLRASLSYFLALPVYTQAFTLDAMREQDKDLRQMWIDKLAADRHGLRLEVGYAF